MPAHWDEWVAATPDPIPPTMTERWLALAPRRLPGNTVTFTVAGPSGPRIAVHGCVMEEPSKNTRIDPYSIFSGKSAFQGLAPDGPHPWSGLRAEDVYPCLLLMLPHYELAPVGPEARDPRACADLVRALVTWAADQGIAAIAFEYLAPEAEPLIAALRAAGWPVVDFADRCDLDITWQDFTGYLGTLPTHRRGNVRREMRALADRGITLSARGLRDDETELIELRCQLVAKYGGTPDAAKEHGLLGRLRAGFAAAEITVVTAEHAGRTLGFGIFVQEGHTWFPILAGTDYADANSRLTYFGALFYEPSRLAPGQGVRRIPYGLGSWEAKRLRGCTLSPMRGAARSLERPPLEPPIETPRGKGPGK